MPAPLTAAEVQLFDSEIPEDVATAMISTIWSRATKLAPCLRTKEWSEEESDDEYEDTQFVKGVIRTIVLRWSDTGSGGVTQRAAGEYSESLSGYSGGLFRPDEIRDLQKLCSDISTTPKATTIPTGPVVEGCVVEHAAWCSINFGGTLCDCGAELTEDGRPLWVR